MKASLLAPALALGLITGCAQLGSLISPVPAGVVTGVVRFNGEPAAGKRVSLAGTEKKATTDASGRYSFSGVAGGARLYVSYVSAVDRPEAAPNEVALWQSAPFTLEGSGREVPAFDVAYNGVLYPDLGMSLIVKPTSPVPFHWSTHPQARSYRVKVTNAGAGSFAWTSEWAPDPMAIFAMEVDPGSYKWTIEIDAGDAGTGLSRSRQVDF